MNKQILVMKYHPAKRKLSSSGFKIDTIFQSGPIAA